QDLERPVEGQSGAQQRCELARQCEHLIARHSLRLEQTAARSARRAGGCSAWEPIGGLRNLHRHQALLAQPLDDVGFAGGVEFAGRDFAARRDGAITENGHQFSRVTRSTSSNVVTPLSALRRPSSYIVSMPSRIASARRSVAVACFITRLRNASVIGTISRMQMRPM